MANSSGDAGAFILISKITLNAILTVTCKGTEYLFTPHLTRRKRPRMGLFFNMPTERGSVTRSTS